MRLKGVKKIFQLELSCLAGEKLWERRGKGKPKTCFQRWSSTRFKKSVGKKRENIQIYGGTKGELEK